MHGFTSRDEYAHEQIMCEEWTFSWWSGDSNRATVEIAGHTSYRLIGASQAWYCWALWQVGKPLLHVTEFDIARRHDPMIVKAQSLWAEFTCDAPFEQWTLGNETYAVELDDPADALGVAHGHVVPVASDFEWYGDGEVDPCPDGYQQWGTLVGTLETRLGSVELENLRAHRTHRWTMAASLESMSSPPRAHLGPRLPFRFPDGTCRDLFLTPAGLQ